MRLTRWQKISLYMVMTAGAIPMLVPLFWLISTSLKPSLGIDEPPADFLPRTKYHTLRIIDRNVPFRTIERQGQETPPSGMAWVKPAFDNNDNSILIPVSWVDERTVDDYKVTFRLFRGQEHESREVEGIVMDRDREARTLRVLVQDYIEVPKSILGPKGGLDPRPGNYPEAISKMNLGPQLVNTLVIVLWSMLGTTLSSALVGYTFARGRFAGRSLGRLANEPKWAMFCLGTRTGRLRARPQTRSLQVIGINYLYRSSWHGAIRRFRTFNRRL